MGRASNRKRFGKDVTPHGHVARRKLSECLLQLIEPYQIERMDRDRFDDLITLAATAWNLAVLPEDARSEALRRAIDPMPLLMRAGTQTIIEELVARKDDLFPGDRRFITNSEVVAERGGFKVLVSSASTTTDD